MVRYQLNVNREVTDMLVNISLSKPALIKKRKNVAALLWVLSILSFLFSAFRFMNGSSGITLIIYGFIFMIPALSVKSMQKAALQKNLKNLDRIMSSGTVEYLFDENGVQIKSEMGESQLHWDAFPRYTVSGDFLCLERRDSRVVLVKQSELSKEDLQELLCLLEANIPQKQ